MADLTCPVFNSQESGAATQSTGSGAYTTLATCPALVTKGFPVEIKGIAGSIYGARAASGDLEIWFRIHRDSTQIAEFPLRVDAGTKIEIPAGAIQAVEMNLAPGSYVYKLEGKVVTGDTVGTRAFNLFARELERTIA